MNCEQAIELLPWYRNGTLEPAEAEAVRRHLASCATCPQELAETEFVAAVALAHLPTEALLARAEGAPSPLDPALVEEHLATCESCTGELAMIEEGRRALEAAVAAAPDAAAADDAAKVIPFRGRPVAVATPLAGVAPAWRWTAIAATVLLVVATGGLLANRVEVERLGQASAARPVSEVPAGADAQGMGARPNPVVESLYPAATVRRGEGGETALLRLPHDVGFVTLLLVPPLDLPYAGPFAVEILGEGSEVVERVDGLRLQEAGDLSLLLPATLLVGDRLEIRLLAPADDGEAVVAVYRATLERP